LEGYGWRGFRSYTVYLKKYKKLGVQIRGDSRDKERKEENGQSNIWTRFWIHKERGAAFLDVAVKVSKDNSFLSNILLSCTFSCSFLKNLSFLAHHIVQHNNIIAFMKKVELS
jgi:hypothetical protein